MQSFEPQRGEDVNERGSKQGRAERNVHQAPHAHQAMHQVERGDLAFELMMPMQHFFELADARAFVRRERAQRVMHAAIIRAIRPRAHEQAEPIVCGERRGREARL